jgi:hypothetical protein
MRFYVYRDSGKPLPEGCTGNYIAEQVYQFSGDYYGDATVLREEHAPVDMRRMKVLGGLIAAMTEAESAIMDEVEVIPPEPEPTPQRFEHGIDASLLVLDVEDGGTGKGIGYVAAPDGTLLPIVYAHESPYDMPALREKIAKAKADHATRKAADKAERDALKAALTALSVDSKLDKSTKDALKAVSDAAKISDDQKKAKDK